MKLTVATVMSPVRRTDSPPTYMLSRPQMDQFDDNMPWMEAVTDWAGNVQACVDGGDRKSKVIVAFLPITLYRSLTIVPRKQTKLSVINIKVILKSSTEHNEKIEDSLKYGDYCT